MPLIRIEYDDKKLNKKDILELSEAIQKIVSEKTDINDVFVYANTSQIKIKVAPVEIFIQMSEHKINDLEILFSEIKSELSKWKKKNSIKYPINLTIIPMKWKFETGI